jgi:peptidoglycan hydrolase CwlO-like protein
MQTMIHELNDKIEAVISRYEHAKTENETLKNELNSLKESIQAKDAVIVKLEEANALKDIEIEEIVNKIELALG